MKIDGELPGNGKFVFFFLSCEFCNHKHFPAATYQPDDYRKIVLPELKCLKCGQSTRGI